MKQYTKEVQPINNNENTSNINIYNNVPGKKEDKKPDATPQMPIIKEIMHQVLFKMV